MPICARYPKSVELISDQLIRKYENISFVEFWFEIPRRVRVHVRYLAGHTDYTNSEKYHYDVNVAYIISYLFFTFMFPIFQ